LKSKYDTIKVDDACITRMEYAGISFLSTDWTTFIDAPITEEELKTAVFQGASKEPQDVMESA
jgi:hypothetical protein